MKGYIMQKKAETQKGKENQEMTHMIEQLKPYLELYEACGNMLGIVPLTEAGYSDDFDFQTNPELRKFLSDWGKEIHSDSVMVLTGTPENFDEQGYHVMMYVFEPSGSDNSGMAGGISTMCGNGVRAVAAYVRDRISPKAKGAKIMTMSGLRTIEWDKDMYAVDMGTMTNKPEDLSQYVNTNVVQTNLDGIYLNSPIPDQIIEKLSSFTSANTWSIGLNGDYDVNGNIDGEPHVVINVPKTEINNINQLRKLAVKAGPIITKNLNIFPKEINVNFIVEGESDKNLVIYNCTHERNLGDDPDHSVTAACGTGSTVAGGVTKIAHNNERDLSVAVHCTGGDMEIISQGKDGLIMKGPANKL
jgi:diaminopimelate epimerase